MLKGPIYLPDALVADLKQATVAAKNHEMCGVITGIAYDGKLSDQAQFYPLKNHAKDLETNFTIAPDDFAPFAGRGDIMIVHSHPFGPSYPSYADMQLQSQWGVPCAIIVPKTHENRHNQDDDRLSLIIHGPVCQTDFISRTYHHGITDCFSFIRDYFAATHDLFLPDLPREWGWWQTGQDYYQAHFADYGFHHINPHDGLQPSDVFVAALRSPVPNHGGIYRGGGLIKHHLAGAHPIDPSRLITEEPLTRLQPFISLWLRHNSL